MQKRSEFVVTEDWEIGVERKMSDILLSNKVLLVLGARLWALPSIVWSSDGLRHYLKTTSRTEQGLTHIVGVVSNVSKVFKTFQNQSYELSKHESKRAHPTQLQSLLKQRSTDC